MTNWLKSAVKWSGILFLFTLSMQAWATTDFPDKPAPFRYVNDYTHTLSTQELQALEAKLQQYSSETSSQIAVVMIGSTGQYVISDYAFQLGKKWGIGRAKLNNGVLMLIAKNDRKVFIATGSGLEGALPDAILSRIIRNTLKPNFRQEYYAKGIDEALEQIISASKGEYDALTTDEATDDYVPFIMVCVFILFVLFGELSWRRSAYVSPRTRDNLRDAAVLASILANSHRSRHGGNGFGGGFGGGSSGGFGGGDFGGGGAGGSW